MDELSSNNPPKWKTVSSNYIVNDKWLKLRADNCLTPEGKTIDSWYVLEYPEWINCVAVDKDNNVAVLKHYRQGVGEYVQEIVGGVVEDGEMPLVSIKRELYEEIGYRDGQIIQTGVSYANPSSQNNKVHSFLAVNGSFSKSTLDETGASFVIEKLRFADFVNSFIFQKSNAVFQSLHLTAIFFALNYIKSSKEDHLTGLRNQLEELRY